MQRVRFSTLASLLASTVIGGMVPAASHAAPRASTIVPWLSRATPEGAMDRSKMVTVALFLGMRDEAGLRALIASQSTPGAASYGQYLTPAAFHARFSPLAADVKRVQDTLVASGFTLGTTPDSGLYVEASAPIATVEQMFAVDEHAYAFKGRMLRANAQAPTIPASIRDVVTYVAGLDDSRKLIQPNWHRMDGSAASARVMAAPTVAGVTPLAPPPVAAGNASPFCSSYYGDHQATLATAPGPFPAKLPWAVCGYTPQQVRQAYGVDKVPYDGLFEKVGIVDNYASPTIVFDANRYSLRYALPVLNRLNFTQIVAPGLFDVPADDPCGPQGWYGEETLDVEAVHSIAPRANITYAGNVCNDPNNTALYTLIDKHLVDVITNSYSYGGEDVPPAQITAENAYFEQAAAEGISVLFSSGDDGDQAIANSIASGSWDATSPYVTAVGGTSLALRDKSGAKSEWGWGTYRAYLHDATVSSDGLTIATDGISAAYSFYSGSGGGPSLIELLPTYQANIPIALTNQTTSLAGDVVPLGTQHRATPDISMVGDPYTGFSIGETYTTSGDPIADAPCTPITATTEYCFTSIGGTSLSSPLLAGVLALANEARLFRFKPPVGFVNPAIYSFYVGNPGSTTSPIVDVLPPSTPQAVLRGYSGDPTRVRAVTMNATTNADATTAIEGADTSYTTTAGYDLVTGLGVPYVPSFIYAFTQLK